MRLLNVDTFTFTEFFGKKPPTYAIASHRWTNGAEAEAMWDDVQGKKSMEKAGYQKLQGFVAYIQTHLPFVKWLWMDTCCIKQDNERELSTAINSMFRYYREAEVCLAHLEDVPEASDKAAFEQSVWFRRGWTLQELLAPGTVVFLSQDWQVIGHKGHSGREKSGMTMHTGPSLEERVSKITAIPQMILHDYRESESLTAEEKLRWADGRETLYGEDLSYCLLGILGVSMNIRYGDGKETTRQRLLQKMAKRKGLAAPGEFAIPFSLQGIPATDYFVPREADMQHLADFFSAATPVPPQQRVFVVHGMGGMGKTQLCAAFAKGNADHFTAVFWLDGSSKDALQRAMANAALRLPAGTLADVAPMDAAELRDAFLKWLSRSGNTKWLLIIDNIDRDWQTRPKDEQAYDYRDFLPHRDQGSILITTRLQRLQRPNASLKLRSVSDVLAKEMIERRAGKGITDIEQLLPQLNGLPLALAQAGAYLGTTGMSVPEYLQHYKATWDELMRNQNEFPLQEYAERSVLTTWKMSYKQVEKVNVLAARLLDLWVFLYHGDIWADLVLAGHADVAQDDDGAWSMFSQVFSQVTQLSLQHSIGILAQYSMVDTMAAGQRITIHPVVHVWCLHNIDGCQAQQQQLLNFALRSVAAKVRSPAKDATSEMGLRLAAHAKAVGAKIMMFPVDEELSDECHRTARFLDEWEKSQEAENLYLRALRGFEKAWGPLCADTLDVVNNLGGLYYSQGKMAAAEQMLVRALCGFEKTTGPDQLPVLRTLNNLGTLYEAQGRVAEAEKMLTWALRGFEKAGLDNASMLDTMHNLGVLYSDQGKLTEAKKLYTRSVDGKEKIWGLEHPSTLETVSDLGLLYYRQGQKKKAEEMYMRALRGLEKAWGPDHMSTLIPVDNLGILFADQGRMVEAKDMYLRALRGKEKAWGPEHTSTLDTVNKLGNLYRDQGQMAEAEVMYLRALTGYEKLAWVPRSRIDSVHQSLLSLREERRTTHGGNGSRVGTASAKAAEGKSKNFSKVMHRILRRS